MNAHDELCLSVWQQLRHLTPEERIQNLDDQLRIDRMLREFLSPNRRDEYEEIQRRVSEIFACPEIIGSPSSSHLSGAL